jgi:hypothetical protein
MIGWQVNDDDDDDGEQTRTNVYALNGIRNNGLSIQPIKAWQFYRRKIRMDRHYLKNVYHCMHFL